MWLDGNSSKAAGALRNFAFLTDASSMPSLANSSSNSSLGHAGPGYCSNGWSARAHGADYDIDTEGTALRGVDLNDCLSHCWGTEDCFCVSFERDMHIMTVADMEAHWQVTGTCWMHHKCDAEKVDKGQTDSETCIVRS